MASTSTLLNTHHAILENYVFKYLSAQELLEVCLVCKKLWKLGSNSICWKSFVEKFPSPTDLQPGQSYKSQYLQEMRYFCNAKDPIYLQCISFFEETRVVMLGRIGAGKSATVLQLVDRQFIANFDPSAEGLYQTILQVERKPFKLNIWDTAYKEENPMRLYYSEAMKQGNVFVLCYSVGSLDSFHAIPEYYSEVTAYHSQYKPIILVGTKRDLPDTERQVTVEQGKEMAKRLGIIFMEISAKENASVNHLFTEIIWMHTRVYARINPTDVIPHQTQQQISNQSRKKVYCKVM